MIKHACRNCGEPFELDELGCMIECCSPETWPDDSGESEE